MTLVTLSSGPQATTDFVITWDARIPNSPAPCSVRPWTMSRSEISPRNVVPSWLTTRAPIPLDRSSQTIVEIVVSGNVVATLSPLALRIDATFMMRPSLADPGIEPTAILRRSGNPWRVARSCPGVTAHRCPTSTLCSSPAAG